MQDTTHWDLFQIDCPHCEGSLAPLAESVDDSKSGTVKCTTCEDEFTLTPIPKDSATWRDCLECGGPLSMSNSNPGNVSCEDCDAEFTIEEVSWLSPASKE